MNIRTLASTALAAATIVVLAGCSSNSSPTTPALNRTDPRAVSDAFAKAWAGGDLTTACSYMGGSALRNLTAANKCSGAGAWTPQTPQEFKSCTDSAGAFHVFYNVAQQVDRFLIFGTELTESGGAWAVTGFSENSPGEQLHGCETAQPSGTA